MQAAEMQQSTIPTAAPTSSTQEDDRCCFVCAGDAKSEPLLDDVCACRTLAVHASCQQQLMRVTPTHMQGACGVCKAPYKNVRFVWRPELRVPCQPCDTDALVKAMIIPMGFHSIGDMLFDRISVSLLPVYALLYGGLWLLHLSWGSLWQFEPVVTEVAPCTGYGIRELP